MNIRDAVPKKLVYSRSKPLFSDFICPLRRFQRIEGLEFPLPQLVPPLRIPLNPKHDSRHHQENGEKSDKQSDHVKQLQEAQAAGKLDILFFRWRVWYAGSQHLINPHGRELTDTCK
ncbi:MAG: hypothetical protein AAF649_06745 [Verrucomicrobiota bacterium]